MEGGTATGGRKGGVEKPQEEGGVGATTTGGRRRRTTSAERNKTKVFQEPLTQGVREELLHQRASQTHPFHILSQHGEAERKKNPNNTSWSTEEKFPKCRVHHLEHVCVEVLVFSVFSAVLLLVQSV